MRLPLAHLAAVARSGALLSFALGCVHGEVGTDKHQADQLLLDQPAFKVWPQVAKAREHKEDAQARAAFAAWAQAHYSWNDSRGMS